MLTIEFLKKRRACPNAINFFRNNYPKGIDLDKYEVKGTYLFYPQWIEDALNTIYKYNNDGKITQITCLDRRTTFFKYDSLGHKISETNVSPAGEITSLMTFIYDSHNRVKSRVYTDYKTPGYMMMMLTTNTYDYNGDLVCVLNNGKATLYRYEHGKVILRIDSDSGSELRYKYDNRGNRIEESDNQYGTVSYKYDAQNRLIKQTTENDEICHFLYDKRGNCIRDTTKHNAIYRKFNDKNNLVEIKTISKFQELERVTSVTTYTYAYANNMLMSVLVNGKQVLWLEPKTK